MEGVTDARSMKQRRRNFRFTPKTNIPVRDSMAALCHYETNGRFKKFVRQLLQGITLIRVAHFGCNRRAEAEKRRMKGAHSFYYFVHRFLQCLVGLVCSFLH